MKLILIKMVMLAILVSCDVFDPGNDYSSDDRNSVHIEYLGHSASADVDLAAFRLVNDSTATIQYFACDTTTLYYSAEVLSDTGWVSHPWSWCGTGAVYIQLEPENTVEFNTLLPDSSCSWRVRLAIADMSGSKGYILYSERLEYNKP